MNLQELKAEKIRAKRDRVPFPDEWHRYRFYHPSTAKTKKGFERNQDFLIHVADWMLNDEFHPAFTVEWRSFGDTMDRAKERAREVLSGAEPKWEECVRLEAYYFTPLPRLEHPEGKPMPPPSSATTLYVADEDGEYREPTLEELPENERWYKEAVQLPYICWWCGRELSDARGVCRSCGEEAGIGIKDPASLGQLDAEAAGAYDRAIGKA